MKQKPALGRGLDALFSSAALNVNTDEPAVHPDLAPTPGASGREVLMLPLSMIDVNPGQPRKVFEEGALTALSQSVAEFGVLQPVLVVPGVEGRYRLVAGERRFRASMQAGLTEIPCLMLDADPTKRLEIALIENIQREQLSPFETAQAIDALMQETGMTQEVCAKRLGMGRVNLANTLRLLQFSPQMQAHLAGLGLSSGHCRALLPAPESLQKGLATRVAAQGLSVRQTEALVRAAHRPPAPAPKPSDLTPLARNAQRSLGMKVSVDGSLEKGTITLRYDNREALERFFSLVSPDTET